MSTNFTNIQNITPAQIVAPHEVRDEKKLCAITASMKLDGWTGRPLLVIAVYNDYTGKHEFQAITGTHRTAAAKKARIKAPCLVVRAEDLARGGYTTKYRDGRHHTYDASGCNVDGYEELIDVCREIGLDDAADLIATEIEHEEM